MVTVKAIHKSGETGPRRQMALYYFAHFLISNEGKEPVFELEVDLVDRKKNPILGCRETVLNVGEKLEWKPDLAYRPDGEYYPEGQYYIRCQYRTVDSEGDKIVVNQTWLPFTLTQADKLGEVHVASKPLEFKKNIL
jgi:hypothetical protein